MINFRDFYNPLTKKQNSSSYAAVFTSDDKCGFRTLAEVGEAEGREPRIAPVGQHPDMSLSSHRMLSPNQPI